MLKTNADQALQDLCILAQATAEQKQAVEHVHQNTDQIRQQTDANTSLAHTIKAEADKLEKLVHALHTHLSQFETIH